MPVDEIQQRKQKQPHNIDEVPVQTEVLDRCNVSARELALVGTNSEPDQQHDSDDHVECVHTGHREVEREEHLRLLCHIRRERLLGGLAGLRVDRRIYELRNIEVRARDVVLLELLRILNILDSKEGQPEDRGQDQEYYQQAPLPDFGSPHAQRHEEPGADQENRIDRAELDAELVRGGDKGFVVPVPVQKISEEEAAEEHDLRQQEKPHPQGAGLALLLLRLKVMTVLRQRHMMVGLVYVCLGVLRNYQSVIQRS